MKAIVCVIFCITNKGHCDFDLSCNQLQFTDFRLIL